MGWVFHLRSNNEHHVILHTLHEVIFVGFKRLENNSQFIEMIHKKSFSRLVVLLGYTMYENNIR